MIELQQFVAVAEKLSFRKATPQLRISQPPPFNAILKKDCKLSQR
jgi:DNA-binding transcriptional LysR family regulator